MGLLDLFKRKAAPTKIEDPLNKILKDTETEYRGEMRKLTKINNELEAQARLKALKTKREEAEFLLNAPTQGEEYEDDEDDEDFEPQSFEDNLLSNLFKGIAKGNPANSSSSPTETLPDPFNSSHQSPVASQQTSAVRQEAQSFIAGLTDQQLTEYLAMLKKGGLLK